MSDDPARGVDAPRDLVTRIVSWTLRAVSHDLNGAGAALPLLSSSALEAPDDAAELAAGIDSVSEGLRTRVERMRVLIEGPETSTPLDETVRTLLALVGVAVRRTRRLVPELASGVSVPVPPVVVSHAVLVALYAITARTTGPVGPVRVATSSAGGGTVSIEAVGEDAPELDAGVALLRVLLDGRGAIEVERTAGNARIALTFGARG